MVTPFLSDATAERIKVLRLRGQATVRQFHDDTYTAWAIDRPDGVLESWDDGTADEAWVPTGSGTGRLYENGAGGPVADEVVISVESPYRFRTLTAAGLVPGITWLVINGDRLFRVQAFKPEDADDTLANAYLEEVFGRTLPAVTP